MIIIIIIIKNIDRNLIYKSDNDYYFKVSSIFLIVKISFILFVSKYVKNLQKKLYNHRIKLVKDL
jgi:hypothetical protein